MAQMKIVLETFESESEMSYDEILADLLSKWVKDQGLTLARVSEISGVSVAEIEAFVAGDAPAPEAAFAPILAFANKSMAAVDKSVIEYRRPPPPPPAKISSGYWSRLARTWPDSLARFLHAAAPHLKKNPSHGYALTESFKLIVRLAETKSADVSELEAAAADVIAEMYEMGNDVQD